jgi:hypothetical protein
MRNSQSANRRASSDGFALLEVLVASGLLVAIAVGVSQIAGRAVRASVEARVRTMASVAAVQKMEQLRALTWSEVYDPSAGLFGALSDLTTDLSVEPASGAGRGLSASPSGTLDANVPPYVDYLDGTLTWLASGATPPAAAVYIRRWSVQPLAPDPGNTLLLEVVVMTGRAGSSAPTADDVRLASVKSRRAR